MTAVDQAGNRTYAVRNVRVGRSFGLVLGLGAVPAEQQLRRRRPLTALPEPEYSRDVGKATRYTRSGDLHIAYSVAGDADADLLYVPTWIGQIEVLAEEPSIASFLERVCGFARLISFDRRGAGLSDPWLGVPTLEEQMDDVLAVMDAAGSERAHASRLPRGRVAGDSVRGHPSEPGLGTDPLRHLRARPLGARLRLATHRRGTRGAHRGRHAAVGPGRDTQGPGPQPGERPAPTWSGRAGWSATRRRPG